MSFLLTCFLTSGQKTANAASLQNCGKYMPKPHQVGFIRFAQSLCNFHACATFYSFGYLHAVWKFWYCNLEFPFCNGCNVWYDFYFWMVSANVYVCVGRLLLLLFDLAHISILNRLLSLRPSMLQTSRVDIWWMWWSSQCKRSKRRDKNQNHFRKHQKCSRTTPQDYGVNQIFRISHITEDLFSIFTDRIIDVTSKVSSSTIFSFLIMEGIYLAASLYSIERVNNFHFLHLLKV